MQNPYHNWPDRLINISLHFQKFISTKNIQQQEKALMIPRNEILLRLLRSNTSFLIYGQKACGKTKLIHDLFQQAENDQYIQINCTLTAKKSNFLRLFNVQLNKYLAKRGLIFTKLGHQQNLDSWIGQIKRLIFERDDLVECLDNLYIFMDNIEEMVITQSFMPAFYSACQKEFPFRFSFIFCGINFLRKEYTLELPFRTMIAFCMPKPTDEFNKIIETEVRNIFQAKIGKSVVQAQKEKTIGALSNQIKAAFENIQFNLQKMINISRVIAETTLDLMDTSDLYKSLMKLINLNKIRQIIQQVKQNGPVQEYMMKRKIDTIENEEIVDISPNLEYYSHLILASVHLADYYTEKEDKRRFQDYKNRTNARNKDLKKNDFKIGKHNIHRIIAISQALESQAKENDKEQCLTHHSLDYYATFEHLKTLGRLRPYGNKITGVVKEEQAKAFLTKCQLKYEQFMSS